MKWLQNKSPGFSASGVLQYPHIPQGALLQIDSGTLELTNTNPGRVQSNLIQLFSPNIPVTSAKITKLPTCQCSSSLVTSVRTVFRLQVT